MKPTGHHMAKYAEAVQPPRLMCKDTAVLTVIAPNSMALACKSESLHGAKARRVSPGTPVRYSMGSKPVTPCVIKIEVHCSRPRAPKMKLHFTAMNHTTPSTSSNCRVPSALASRGGGLSAASAQSPSASATARPHLNDMS